MVVKLAQVKQRVVLGMFSEWVIRVIYTVRERPNRDTVSGDEKRRKKCCRLFVIYSEQRIFHSCLFNLSDFLVWMNSRTASRSGSLSAEPFAFLTRSRRSFSARAGFCFSSRRR